MNTKRALSTTLFVFVIGCTTPPPASGNAKEAKEANEVKPGSPAEPPQEMTITSKSPKAAALFIKARELAETSHTPEAIEELKKAVALDPDFALAHAQLSMLLPSKESAAAAAKAKAAAAALPEAEKTAVMIQVANIEGDQAAVIAGEKKLATLLPNDWRAQLALAGRAWEQKNLDEAVTRYKHVAALNKSSGAAWNSLGYIYLQQGKHDDAVAAFQQYAAVAPTDPNAHDSLGDALLHAGKDAEAEASFQKAIAADAKFALAWTGVALTRATRKDWKGALEAMQKYVDATPRKEDRPLGLVELAWWQHTAGKKSDAMGTLSAAQREAQEQGLDYFHEVIALNRAGMLNDQGKFKDALREVDDAVGRCAKLAVPGGRQTNFNLQSKTERLRALAGLGAKADAAKTSAEIEALLKSLPESPLTTSWSHFVRGQSLLAAKDAPGAVSELRQCVSDAASCLGIGVVTAEKAGDKAAADEMRKRLAGNLGRSGDVIFARAQAGLLALK